MAGSHGRVQLGRRRGPCGPPGANECVLSVYAPHEDAVHARFEAALAAGGTCVYEPSQQEWSAFAAQVDGLEDHRRCEAMESPRRPEEVDLQCLRTAARSRDAGSEAEAADHPWRLAFTRPMAGPLRLCAQTGGARNRGPGSPCACPHTTPSHRRHKADRADVRRADRREARLSIRDGIIRPQYRRRKATETRGMSLCLASS